MVIPRQKFREIAKRMKATTQSNPKERIKKDVKQRSKTKKGGIVTKSKNSDKIKKEKKQKPKSKQKTI